VNLPGLGLGLSIPFHPAPAKVSKIVILKLAKINQRKNKKMNKERGESLADKVVDKYGGIIGTCESHNRAAYREVLVHIHLSKVAVVLTVVKNTISSWRIKDIPPFFTHKREVTLKESIKLLSIRSYSLNQRPRHSSTKLVTFT